MRCLWVTRRYPWPAHGGDLLYSGNLITALAETGVRITVVCAGPAGPGAGIRRTAESDLMPVGQPGSRSR